MATSSRNICYVFLALQAQVAMPASTELTFTHVPQTKYTPSFFILKKAII
jgi:hypothetical protein